MKQTELKKQQIRETALGLFIEKGFKSTPMQLIAENAQVSKRTLYKHYPTKTALFIEVLGLLAERSQKTAWTPYKEDEPIEPQLEHILRFKILGLQNQDFRELSKVILPVTMTTPEGTTTLTKMLSRDGPLLSWLRSVGEHGRLNTDDYMLIAGIIQGALEKFVFWPQVIFNQPEPTEEQIEKLIQSLIETFIHQFLKQ